MRIASLRARSLPINVDAAAVGHAQLDHRMVEPLGSGRRQCGIGGRGTGHGEAVGGQDAIQARAGRSVRVDQEQRLPRAGDGSTREQLVRSQALPIGRNQPHHLLGALGTRAIRRRLVVPATPNGMPAAIAIRSSGPASPVSVAILAAWSTISATCSASAVCTA